MFLDFGIKSLCFDEVNVYIIKPKAIVPHPVVLKAEKKLKKKDQGKEDEVKLLLISLDLTILRHRHKWICHYGLCKGSV